MTGGTLYDQRFYDLQQDGSLVSAKAIMPAIFELVQPTSIVDVGCGVGTWLRACQDFGIRTLTGLDGDYVDRSRLLIGSAQFRQCDLEAQNLRDAVGEASFGLALCLEVAEHLTAARADSFVSELCTLSELVAFSAAIPGQGGTNHINEQWPAYWSRIFAEHGFTCFDVLRPILWEREDCEWWYLQNILLFARAGSDAEARLSQAGKPTDMPMSLIHPRNLLQKTLEFNAMADELRQLLTYQPFGRDEAVRMLEGRVDTLRQFARSTEEALAAVQDELGASKSDQDQALGLLREEVLQLRNRIRATEQSTSWRVTAPLRWLKTRTLGNPR